MARVKQVNQWREQFNPLVGLVMARARTLLEQGQRGDYADLQWTYKFVEERYPTLFALVERRLSSLVELDWEVKAMPEESLPEGATPAMAEAQAHYLRQSYQRIDNLKDAIEHLGMATFRGYAHLQKHDCDGDGQIDHLEPLDQWNFVKAGLNGNWFWNPDAIQTGWRALPKENEIKESPEPGESEAEADVPAAASTTPGIDRDSFVIREVKRPVNPIALQAFIRYALATKDWSGFVEIFGIPGGVVIGPPNVPSDKEGEYQSSGEKIAEGGTGYLPNGSDFKYNDSPRGVNPFRDFLRAQSEDVVLAGTGGLLTMLTESGSGTLAGNAHQDTFDKIAGAEAGKVSEVFQRDFDKELIEAKFPGQPVLAYFTLSTLDETAAETLKFKREVFSGFMRDGTVADVLANQTDFKQLTKDVELPVNEEYVDPYLPVQTQQGATVTGEVVRDSEGDVIGAKTDGNGNPQIPNPKTQIGKPADPNPDVPPITNRGPSQGAPSADLETAGRHLVASAVANDLEPIMRRMQLIMQIEDPEIFHAKATALLGEIDKLKGDILKDPAAAQAIAKLMNAGVAGGLSK